MLIYWRALELAPLLMMDDQYYQEPQLARANYSYNYHPHVNVNANYYQQYQSDQYRTADACPRPSDTPTADYYNQELPAIKRVEEVATPQYQQQQQQQEYSTCYPHNYHHQHPFYADNNGYYASNNSQYQQASYQQDFHSLQTARYYEHQPEVGSGAASSSKEATCEYQSLAGSEHHVGQDSAAPQPPPPQPARPERPTSVAPGRGAAMCCVPARGPPAPTAEASLHGTARAGHAPAGAAGLEQRAAPKRPRTKVRGVAAASARTGQQALVPAGALVPTRRKNATRETTAMLKEWLDQHGQNPYPTKGEKIMLSIITKMSLTQVSTWFANARRRMKKENRTLAWVAGGSSSSGGVGGGAPAPLLGGANAGVDCSPSSSSSSSLSSSGAPSSPSSDTLAASAPTIRYFITSGADERPTSSTGDSPQSSWRQHVSSTTTTTGSGS